jgi:urease beta subunit
MPTMDSDGCRPPIPGHADHLFQQHGVQFFRNTGNGDRLGLESADGMLQNPGQQI